MKFMPMSIPYAVAYSVIQAHFMLRAGQLKLPFL